ncbi:hypothetical protein [Agrobacterium tumefaciens]|uniref:hypothetical protein n=1 Tax=Agrobacterium tumefaciens TaxID=358 RepID=UPI00138DFF5E|nr:hypothetical protein [Agrobacterium tumefaciens]
MFEQHSTLTSKWPVVVNVGPVILLNQVGSTLKQPTNTVVIAAELGIRFVPEFSNQTVWDIWAQYGSQKCEEFIAFRFCQMHETKKQDRVETFKQLEVLDHIACELQENGGRGDVLPHWLIVSGVSCIDKKPFGRSRSSVFSDVEKMAASLIAHAQIRGRFVREPILLRNMNAGLDVLEMCDDRKSHDDQQRP